MNENKEKDKDKIQLNNIYNIIEHDIYEKYYPKKKELSSSNFSSKPR